MAKKRAKRADGEKVDFEAALAELEEIVHVLEEGEISLNESLARYEKGVKLLRQCYDVLDGAQRRIEFADCGRPGRSTNRFPPVDDKELSLAEKADRRSRRRSATDNPTLCRGRSFRGERHETIPENII